MCSAIQRNEVQWNAVQRNGMQCNGVQCSAMECSAIEQIISATSPSVPSSHHFSPLLTTSHFASLHTAHQVNSDRSKRLQLMHENESLRQKAADWEVILLNLTSSPIPRHFLSTNTSTLTHTQTNNTNSQHKHTHKRRKKRQKPEKISVMLTPA